MKTKNINSLTKYFRMEADLFDGDNGSVSRIPYDVLRLPEAETVYKNHLNQLHAHQQRLE